MTIPSWHARELREAALSDQDAPQRIAAIDSITDALAMLGYVRRRDEVDPDWLRRREAADAARQALARRGAAQ